MEYDIIYTKRRTLCLQVKNDLKIVVRSPKGISKKVIEKFVSDHTDWIKSQIEKLKALPSLPQSDDDINALKLKTKEIIAQRIDVYSKLMNLKPERVSISSAKKRFGSCSSKGNLNFSFRLALYPVEAIDYVIVHELAHLKEMNHSKRFWKIVEKYLPDYKERQKLLR